MFLPQALAGYDSQEDPLRDLPSSITPSPGEPHLPRDTVLTNSSGFEGQQECGLHCGSRGIWVDKQ